jgi:hypothetical protein
MPSNTAITAALIVTGEVPPDQNCITTVDALLPVIAANMAVQTTDPDSPQSQTDSTAELALNTANTALAQVAASNKREQSHSYHHCWGFAGASEFRARYAERELPSEFHHSWAKQCCNCSSNNCH